MVTTGAGSGEWAVPLPKKNVANYMVEFDAYFCHNFAHFFAYELT